MGVPQFFKYLMRRYGTGMVRSGRIKQTEAIYQDQVPGRVSSLAFDMNSFFYKAAAKVYGEGDTGQDPKRRRGKMSEYQKRQRRKELESADPAALQQELFNTILNEIMTAIETVSPQDTVIFAVDGLAPMAKIQQQRQRRYKSAFTKKGAFFDTNAFSPGTEVMIALDKFLRQEIKIAVEKGERGEGLWMPHKVIYSSHLVPGEGEHKIMEYYRKGIPEGPIAASGGAHVIYGLDSDLIMLSMLLPQKNVFLMREDVEEIVNIQNLRSAIIRDLGTETAIDDFLIMMYLIGNDFLPRIKTLDNLFGEEDSTGKASMSSLDRVLETYRKLKKPLSTDGGKGINWVGLAYFLYELKKYENGFVQSLSKLTYEFPSKVIDNSVERGKVQPRDFRNNWYDYALSAPVNSQDLVKAFAVPKKLTKPTRGQIENMALEFLTGMAWTSLYYRKGMKSINREWSYPYFYAPLINDLAIICGNLVAADPKKRLHIKEYKVFDTMIKYNVVHQMLCILPPPSSDLVPKEVLPFYYSQSPIIDQFPETFLFDEDGKNFEWQMHALVPHADIRRIYTVTQFVKFTRKTQKELKPQDNYIQTRRTTDQILTGAKPSLGQWGRRKEERRRERQRQRQPTSKVKVFVNRIEISTDPSVKRRNPMLKPLSERKVEGTLKQIYFKPRRRVRRVRPEFRPELKPKMTPIEILAQFDMDYSKVPIIFE